MKMLGILVTVLYHSFPCDSYSISDANTLHTALFTNYNKHVLPEHPLMVRAEYNLLTINDLNMKTQVLTTSGWFTVVWNDSRLVWSPSSYGDIQHVYATQSMLWHPELIVENSVMALKNLGEDDTHIRIQYDGEVHWEPPAILTTSCDIDVTFFPYDSQTCPIELASWGFPTTAINMSFYKTNVNLLDYRTNGEWNLISTSQHLSEIVEDDLSYAELVFDIHVERLPGYYIMSVIFPIVITAVLTSVTFLLPVESGEKVGYVLTVLLALAVLLTLFSNSMPTTSKHSSILVVFLTVTLGLASVAIVLTVLTIKLHYKRNDCHSMKWLHRMINLMKSRFHKTEDQTGINKSVNDQLERKGNKVAWKETDTDQANEVNNRKLAEFLDNAFFVLLTVVYIVVVAVFTFTLSLS